MEIGMVDVGNGTKKKRKGERGGVGNRNKTRGKKAEISKKKTKQSGMTDFRKTKKK